MIKFLRFLLDLIEALIILNAVLACLFFWWNAAKILGI